MEYIEGEFENRKDPKVMKMIERILRNLRFFQNFDLETRKHILMHANLVKFDKHSVVFGEGEVADVTYVLVQGNVELRRKLNKFPYLDIAVASLYDGDHFGEEALVVPKKFSLHK